MSLYVVSDLHIQGVDDAIYHSLLSLLRDRAQRGDIVVLAGDLFDLFVGGKDLYRQRYVRFFEESARAIERGVHLHYIEGNHDFMIRRAFRGIPGAVVHTDQFGIELEGKRFYFAHGDLVDAKDFGYRFLRAFFRSLFFRLLVMLLPGSWVDWIGRTSSERSRKVNPELPACLPEGGMERLRKLYRNYAAEQIAQGYDYVVMGHCHDLDEMSFVVGGRPGQYVNVGFPRVHGSFLAWHPGDEKISRERMPDPGLADYL